MARFLSIWDATRLGKRSKCLHGLAGHWQVKGQGMSLIPEWAVENKERCPSQKSKRSSDVVPVQDFQDAFGRADVHCSDIEDAATVQRVSNNALILAFRRRCRHTEHGSGLSATTMTFREPRLYVKFQGTASWSTGS